MQTVTELKELIENIQNLRSDTFSSNVRLKEEALKLIKKGICFVAFYENGQVFFGPSKFIGYKNNELLNHTQVRRLRDGGSTNKTISKILGSEPILNQHLEKEFLNFCENLGISYAGSFGKPPKYWILDSNVLQCASNNQSAMLEKDNDDNEDVDNFFVNPPQISLAKGVSKTKPKNTFFKIDNELNQAIGKEGERFVLEFEKKRLRKIGRDDLAKKIKWVSQDIGDQEGYDILSYDEKDNEIYIEVKTTKQGREAPFWITSNELDFYKRHEDRYRLYRVFNFQSSTKIFVLKRPIESQVILSPNVFIAKFIEED